MDDRFAQEVRRRLGVRLKHWRRNQNLTQEELGERAGLSYKFIGEVERGNGNPTVDTLSKLSSALDIDVAELFGSAGSWNPSELYGLSRKDVQMVREAAKSLGNVAERLEGVTYRRHRSRSRTSKT